MRKRTRALCLFASALVYFLIQASNSKPASAIHAPDAERSQQASFICSECSINPHTRIFSYCMTDRKQIICETFSRRGTCDAARDADTRCR